MGKDKQKTGDLNYAVLNSEEISTGEKLEKYTGEIRWSYLKPHFEAGSLIWVSDELSLTEVGEAVTNDHSDTVDSWKKQGLLLIPSEPHAEYWESIDACFCALVVSPFVLVQPIDSES